jgi:hypothetical protein
MKTLAATAQINSQTETTLKQRQWLTRRRLFWIVAVAALLVYAQSKFWNMPSVGDQANWDYIAQVITRGGVPYRDVVNIKSPLSAYIGAAAIVIARPFGIRDWLALRITFILLAALTVAFVFLITLDYFGSRRVALLAATIMIAFSPLARLNGAGTQPKTPMILFGLVTLWAIIKNRPFTAGVFGMLSALSWQPGLLFVGVAGLAFTRYLTSWRDMKAVRLIAGAAIPLAVCLSYFWAVGALNDFYLWNIDFNATVYGPREVRTFARFYHRIGKMLSRTYHNERFYFYIAAPGLLVAMWQEVRRAKQSGFRSLLDAAPRHAVMIAPIVYFLFCTIDSQGGADLIPILPFVAIFAALAIAYSIKGAARLLARKRPLLNRASFEAWGSAVAAAVIIGVAVGNAILTKRDQSLHAEQADVAHIVSHLEPGDKIYVHGQAEILVLSGLTNASKYYLLDRAKDEYLDSILDGGFAGWLEALKAERPKIVVLSRMKTMFYKNEFIDWVRQDYVMRKGRIFLYYVRKDAAGEITSSPGDDYSQEDTRNPDEY